LDDEDIFVAGRCGCSSAAPSNHAVWALGLLGLLTMRRRRSKHLSQGVPVVE
jgi:MYXO-CTERM domain-containing protein